MLMFRMLLPTKQLLLMMVVVMMMMMVVVMVMMMMMEMMTTMMMMMMTMMLVMGMMVMIINAHVSHAAHQASVSANTQRKVTEFDAFPKFAESHPQRLCFRGKLGVFAFIGRRFDSDLG